MKTGKSFLISVICLFLGLMANSSLAQPTQDDLSVEGLGAGADLVIINVHGPLMTSHNHTVSVTFTVKNQGTKTSGPYKVALYLSTDRQIKPASDRLLGEVTVLKGLEPGERKTAAANVLVPLYGLSGDYYWGAIVGNNAKASTNHVSLVRYSLTDNNDTVTDHKTGYVWQRAIELQFRDLDDANQYCSDLVLGPKSDWRLPRMDELETIVSWTRANPTIDPLFDCFPDYYWSSSMDHGTSQMAWYVNFYNGEIGSFEPSAQMLVRCVRGGI